MTIITLKLNKKTKAGKLLASMIELLSSEGNGVEVVNQHTSKGLDEALKDVKDEKLKEYKNTADLFKSVLDV